ncbi:hypothetical protein ScPMuIL_014831 [Solemya velum]
MEPLSVDTSFEYELDMTMFPGWHEDTRRHQPKLLIHAVGFCSCGITSTSSSCAHRNNNHIASDSTTLSQKSGYQSSSAIYTESYSLDDVVSDRILNINASMNVTGRFTSLECSGQHSRKRKLRDDDHIYSHKPHTKRHRSVVTTSKNNFVFKPQFGILSVSIPGLFSPTSRPVWHYSPNTKKEQLMPRES